MALLGREAILAADDIVTDEVEVPEWGGSVLVRAMTGAERDRLEASAVGNGKKLNLANFRARMCAASIVDEAGNRLFGEADLVTLGQKSSAALNRVFEVAQRLSGMSDEDVEELTGNSEPGLNGSSTSA